MSFLILFVLLDFNLSYAKSEKVQVIDENGNYNSFGDKIHDSSEMGIVTIIGPQSSGKSTLLNALFQTDFDVMNDLVDRQRTTSGIWVEVAQVPQSIKNLNNKYSLLIFDVEGSDSSERTEHKGETFENRAALFSLSMANVLIINLWETAIGTNYASCAPLLRTVFQAALDLNLPACQKKGEMTLLFVLEGYAMRTPVPKLKEKLEKMLNEIWKKMDNPHKISLDSLFNRDVYAVPHLHHSPKEYKKAIAELQQWFFNPKNNNYLKDLKTKHFENVQQVSEVGGELWANILMHRPLQVEVQLERIALLRCENTFARALKESEPVRTELLRYTSHTSTKAVTATGTDTPAPPDGVLQKMRAAVDGAYELYRRDAPHNVPDVYEAHADRLHTRLEKEYHDLEKRCREYGVVQCARKHEEMIAETRAVRLEWEGTIRSKGTVPDSLLTDVKAAIDTKQAYFAQLAPYGLSGLCSETLPKLMTGLAEEFESIEKIFVAYVLARCTEIYQQLVEEARTFRQGLQARLSKGGDLPATVFAEMNRTIADKLVQYARNAPRGVLETHRMVSDKLQIELDNEYAVLLEWCRRFGQARCKARYEETMAETRTVRQDWEGKMNRRDAIPSTLLKDIKATMDEHQAALVRTLPFGLAGVCDEARSALKAGLAEEYETVSRSFGAYMHALCTEVSRQLVKEAQKAREILQALEAKADGGLPHAAFDTMNATIAAKLSWYSKKAPSVIDRVHREVRALLETSLRTQYSELERHDARARCMKVYVKLTSEAKEYARKKQQWMEGLTYQSDVVNPDLSGMKSVLDEKKALYKQKAPSHFPTEFEEVLRKLDGDLTSEYNSLVQTYNNLHSLWVEIPATVIYYVTAPVWGPIKALGYLFE